MRSDTVSEIDHPMCFRLLRIPPLAVLLLTTSGSFPQDNDGPKYVLMEEVKNKWVGRSVMLGYRMRHCPDPKGHWLAVCSTDSIMLDVDGDLIAFHSGYYGGPQLFPGLEGPIPGTDSVWVSYRMELVGLTDDSLTVDVEFKRCPKRIADGSEQLRSAWHPVHRIQRHVIARKSLTGVYIY